MKFALKKKIKKKKQKIITKKINFFNKKFTNFIPH